MTLVMVAVRVSTCVKEENFDYILLSNFHQNLTKSNSVSLELLSFSLKPFLIVYA